MRSSNELNTFLVKSSFTIFDWVELKSFFKLDRSLTNELDLFAFNFQFLKYSIVFILIAKTEPIILPKFFKQNHHFFKLEFHLSFVQEILIDNVFCLISNWCHSELRLKLIATMETIDINHFHYSCLSNRSFSGFVCVES